MISAEFEKPIGKIKDFELYHGNNSRGVSFSTAIHILLGELSCLQKGTNNKNNLLLYVSN